MSTKITIVCHLPFDIDKKEYGKFEQDLKTECHTQIKKFQDTSANPFIKQLVVNISAKVEEHHDEEEDE